MTMRAFAVAVLALVGCLALATPGQASVNGRERRQHERIQQGRRSGELTSREAARLAREQARIEREERRYRANDGRLGPRERADLDRDLNRANRHIYRQKHDGQRK